MRTRMVSHCSSGWVLRILEWKSPELPGAGWALSCTCHVPVHTAVSCLDCWLSICCVFPEASRPWLVPASQGPPETLGPEDCVGPLFRGLRPPQGPARPGPQHPASAGGGVGMDRGPAAPGRLQVLTQPSPGPRFPAPKTARAEGTRNGLGRQWGPQRGGPSPRAPPQGDRCVMGQQRSFRRRKPASWCVTGRSFTAALTARVCPCRASDFLW